MIEFIRQMLAEPMLLVSSLLTLGVILVNGWTDAPNAIATCVSTRAISVKKAIVMAAVFNFLGVLIMTLISSKVAATIYNMVDFGNDSKSALIALCAAMAAIVVWATAAWYFGIPTSESHALIAGLTGAAVAIHGSLGAVNAHEWVKVILGLFLSTVLGFAAGLICSKATVLLFRNKDRLTSAKIFSRAQIFSSAAMAFMHGAQDGQKFMAIFLLSGTLVTKSAPATFEGVPDLWLIMLISLTMALGTSIGGEKIIKSVGMDMVKLKPYQGFSSDLGAALCLLFCSLGGIPVSTTHTKSTSIMGVGAAKGIRRVNWSVARELMLTWVFTFPGCTLIGYFTAKIFLFAFK